MKIYITWILLFMIGQQINGRENYDHDFEIFHTDNHNLKSQSLYPSPDLQSTNYYYNDDYDNDGNSHNVYRRYADYKLSKLAPISAEPEITKSPLYVSPDSISHRFVRSPQSPGHRDYINSYKDFLDKHFSRSYHADDNEQNAKYQQNDKQSERQSEYLPRYGDDVERHNVPSSSGGGHRDYNYNDEYERIRKLSQEQEKSIQQNPKNCKTEIRGSMKCSVCVDPKSGDNSESCAFSATPTDNKYAYTRERNYDSKNDDNNDNQSKPSKKKSEYKLTENNNQHPQQQQQQQQQKQQQHQDNQHQQQQQQQQQQTTETPRYRPRTRRPKTTLSTASETLSALINEPNQKSAAIRQEPKQSLKTFKKQQKRDESKKYRASYKAEESRPQRDVIGLDPFLYGNGGVSSGSGNGGGGGGDASSDKISDKSFGYDYYASKLSDYANDKNNNNKNNDHNDNNKNNNNNDNHNNHDDNHERSQNLRSYEDYFAHVFPETKHSANEPIYEQPESIEILPGYDSNKNVADVLAEFKKKDWSTCSKSNRGDLTCYNCKDDKGVKHEECMYESAANPTKSRLAYTELKEYHDSDAGDYGKDSHGGSSDIVSRISKNDGVDEKNNDKNNGKSRRSVVIKKRKITDNNTDKLETPSATPAASAAVPKPEDIFENQSGEKRTFKRTVSFRIEKNDEVDPDKSKIVVFEHNYSQED